MRQILIENKTHPLTTPIAAGYCGSFFCRLRGLMFRDQLGKREGLLLDEGSDTRLNSAIHMLFMRFDIAAVWINTERKVVDTRLARRWRPSYMPSRPARYILETRVEYLYNFCVGDQLQFRE